MRADGASTWFTGMVRFDSFSVVGRGVIILATALGMLAAWASSHGWVRAPPRPWRWRWWRAGFMLMAASAHFFVLFSGRDRVDLALRPRRLCGESPRSDEAAVKYFLLGSFASALFIYGVALAYAGTGSLVFEEVATALGGQTVAVAYVSSPCWWEGSLSRSPPPLPLLGTRRLPGAPAEFVGFMAVAKVGGFAGLMLVLLDAFEPVEEVGRVPSPGWLEYRSWWAPSSPSSRTMPGGCWPTRESPTPGSS